MAKNDEEKLGRRILNSFTKNRKDTLKFLEYVVQKRPWLFSNEKIQRIANCGQNSVFQKIAWKEDAKLARAHFCHYHYLCRSCANARSIKQIQQLRYYIEQNHLQLMNRYYVVLTIKHEKTDTLDDLMEKLLRHRQKLSKRAANSRRESQKTKSVFGRFIGMISVVEVTWTDSAWRHPHINLFGYMEDELEIIERKNRRWQTRYVNQEMETEWEEITGDSYIINVNPIDSLWESYFSKTGTWEVFKYTLKLHDLPIDKRLAFVEYMERNKKQRLMVKHWTFRWLNKFCEGVNLWPLKPEDLEDVFYHIFIDDDWTAKRLR